MTGTLKETPSQTAGPYVHIGCTPCFAGVTGVYSDDLGGKLRTGNVNGHEITLRGTIFDGVGTPLKDALVEIWQADAAGLYSSPMETRGKADPNFAGWGRCPCDTETGEFRFETVKPGPVPYPDGRTQAPHISVWIVARGLNIGLQTRIYFPDETQANAADPILSLIADPARVQTLIATQEDGGYRHDIHLQGEAETVFFDI